MDSPPKSLSLMPFHAWRFIYQPAAFYTWLRASFGELVLLKTPERPLVMTLTAEGAKQVLTVRSEEYAVFQKAAFKGLAGDNSLFVLENEPHRNERRLLMPSFHTHYVKNYGRMIRQIVEEHTARLHSGYMFRATDLGLDISRDVILSVVYGDDFDRIKDSGRQIVRQMLDVAHPMLEYIEFTQRGWFPPFRRFERIKRAFTRFTGETIRFRREHPLQDGSVLETLLNARDADGQPRGDQEIIDELYTILLPGHATSGVAVSWVLYELFRHPAVLQRVREEISALGNDPNPTDIFELPFLKAVCNESMRMHTIVTEIARLALTPREIHGFTFPAGFGLAVGISAVHHDPALYPNPWEFHPERFLERSYSAFEFMPFGGSHRRCLGAELSNFEVQVVVGMIVKGWDMVLLRNEETEVRHNLGMGPKYRVPMKVVGRLE